MSDPTTRLREALAEVIERSDGEPYTEVDDVYLLNADAILACLPEHRDDVLAVLGMEQVGWWSDEVHREHGVTTTEWIACCLRFNEEGEASMPNARAVYAFRPKEQP